MAVEPGMDASELAVLVSDRACSLIVRGLTWPADGRLLWRGAGLHLPRCRTDCNERGSRRSIRKLSFPKGGSLTDSFRQVKRDHLIQAAKSVRKRITYDMIRYYERWRDQSGVRSA